MTTAVGLALTKALDAAPGKGWNMDQKIHNYLKDHPHKTKEEITKALGFGSVDSVYACLRRALIDGLLRKRKGSRFTKAVWEYEVVFKEFQQPLWVRKKKETKVEEEHEVLIDTPKSWDVNFTPKTEKPHKFNIDSLTLGEARNLYNELHKMFGGGK